MDPRHQWFGEGRFGLFIHWGLYALSGGVWKGKEMEYIGEWIQARYRIPNAEYEQLAAQFNPVGFDAEEWIVTAKKAGMKYLVFTTKHHEGFAMYKSSCSRFNIVEATPFNRDVLAELAAACRKHDFKLGIYYSQDLDWHEPDGGDPGPDFPKNFGMSWGNDWDFPNLAGKKYQRYFDGKVIPQLTEILSAYGPISVIWFDCPLTISRDNSEKLVKLVKKLQPGCLINTRIGQGFGDYGSLGDNQLPATRRAGLWESPGTLNDTWGFKAHDHHWKTPREVVHVLASLAEKDTNYLLNVGPQPDGRFPGAAVEVLEKVGGWLARYGESIYRTWGNPFPGDFDWGWMTVSLGEGRRSTRLNLLLRNPDMASVTLCGVNERVRRCYDLANPVRDLAFTQTATTVGVGVLKIALDQVRPDEFLTVVGVELDTAGEPALDRRVMPQNGFLMLRASQGQLQHGSDAKESGLRGVGAAGESFHGTGHSSLDETGCLVEWQNPTDRIEWEMFWPQAAECRIELVTVSRVHSARWVSGQTVRMTYVQGDYRREWETVLAGRQVDAAGSQCYSEGVAAAGHLAVPGPGLGRLSVVMTDPGSSEAALMGLREIRIRLGI
jgi:alpha-L-fucosidase